MIQAKPVFLELLSASAAQLQHDLEQTRDEPLADELRERTLTLLDILLQVEVPHDWPMLCKLLLLIAPKMELAGFRNEWIPYLERALSLCHQFDDDEGGAEIGFQLGILYQWQSRWQDAKGALRTSAETYRGLGKNQSYANILNRLGYIECSQGNLSGAEQYARQALELLKSEDHEHHFSQFVLGKVALDKSDWQTAERHFRQSLAVCQQNNDRRNTARRQRDIGLVLDKQDRLRPARNAYEQAICMFDEIGDRAEAAVTRMNLGIVYSKLGNSQTALDYYSEAEQVFRSIHDEFHLGHIFLNRGLDYQLMGCMVESERSTKASIAILERLARPALLTLAQTNLGELYIECERYLEAEEILYMAQMSAKKIREPSVAEHYQAEIKENLNKLSVFQFATLD